MQQCSDLSESVTVDFYRCCRQSNNNPVNDMTTLISGLVNDLDKVIMTKSSQSLFGL